MDVERDLTKEALERYQRASMALWDNLREYLNALEEMEDDRPGGADSDRKEIHVQQDQP